MPGNRFQHFGFTARATRLSRTTNYTELIPILIKAIQEQQQEIEDLKRLVQSRI
jgi:hypothetical protein